MDAITAITVSVAAARQLLDHPSSAMPRDTLTRALHQMAVVRCAIEAAYLCVLRQIDGHGDGGGSRTEGLVREATGASAGAARRDVAAARATAPDGVLAGFDPRLTQGAVCREHVDVAVACMDAIPHHLLDDAENRAAVTSLLHTVVDAGSSARELRTAVRMMLDRVDPDGHRRRDPGAAQRRFLDMNTDSTGMLVGRFQLDAIAGASLRAAIDAHSAPEPMVNHRDGSSDRDLRTARQRRADALATVSDLALGVAQPRRGERPRVVVHATSAQLVGAESTPPDHADTPPLTTSAVTESGEVLQPWALARLACDAVLQRVVMDASLGPLDVGREHRLVTIAQRRALAARDEGCIVCGAPPDWCDAHHIVFWANGGSSDMDNLVLLCPRHHTAVHAGEWFIVRADQGGLRLIPPRHVDPRQRPRRPITEVLHEAIAHLDKQWRLEADPSP